MKIVNTLNSICKEINFTIVEEPISIHNDIIVHPDSYKKLDVELKNDMLKYDIAFIFTKKPYNNNYFFLSYNKKYIVSLSGWNLLTDLPMDNGLVYFVIDILALCIDNSYRHDESTGCIYDFLWNKSGIDDGMRQAYICQDCLTRISNLKLTEKKKLLFECIKKLMNDLSSASKWNQNIIEYWGKDKSVGSNLCLEVSQEPIKKPKKEKEIHVLIASPGDAQVERKLLLDKLERKFRIDSHEEHCNHRLIVHGWEDLATQSGYGQDVINIQLLSKVDIVLAIFKHRLGSPTINTSDNTIRSESGTVEELLYAISNCAVPTPPLGMVYYYSKSPNPSFDSSDFKSMQEQWKKLKEFKRSIEKKILHKPYNTADEILNMATVDLIKNINGYFILK